MNQGPLLTVNHNHLNRVRRALTCAEAAADTVSQVKHLLAAEAFSYVRGSFGVFLGGPFLEEVLEGFFRDLSG
jgi:hypothetical protein